MGREKLFTFHPPSYSNRFSDWKLLVLECVDKINDIAGNNVSPSVVLFAKKS